MKYYVSIKSDMQLLSGLLPRFVLASFLAAALCTLASCGGGTTGTGGTGSDEFSGRVLSTNGAPIPFASITVKETGESAQSDESGNFDIESSFNGTTANLLVETEHAQATVVVDQIPETPSLIEVALEVNEAKGSVVVTSKKVSPKPKKPRKTPVPTPVSPDSTPTPEATPTPSASPGATSTPDPDGATPSPSASPNPSSSAMPSPTPRAAKPAIFRGTVSTDTVNLLSRARIGIVGTARRVGLQANGGFFFREIPATGIAIEIKVGKKRAQALLEGVDGQTKRVVMSIQLHESSSGELSILIQAIQVITRETTSTGASGDEADPTSTPPAS